MLCASTCDPDRIATLGARTNADSLYRTILDRAPNDVTALDAAAALAEGSGDSVRVRNAVTEGHTRVPRYLRRQIGRVERVACVWPNPGDSAASGTYGEAELVYTVAFNGGDLFGPGADHTLSADLADSDLEKP